MHGVSLKNNFEQRQARLLEASGYPGPISAAMVSADETSRLVAETAEQRRLMREAGLLPPRNSHGIAERVSMGMQRFVARIASRRAASGPVVSSPDHA
jgi:hypothetical protein